ncbi:MAG TPA: thioredoxin-like domain-containing protein [Pyrinomonadaceae bacterium]|jgi:thiol-disulfide isomerase/thioredoxin
MNSRYFILIGLGLAAAVLYFLVVAGQRPLKRDVTPVATQSSASESSAPEESEAEERDRLIDARRARRAPELAEGTWINSEPLTVEGLRGRVILLDFWTFGCYNCRNTLPALKRFHERYNSQGLTIIGVHSPEFEGEKSIDNVRREVRSLGILYPVLTDNDYLSWNAYGIQAWPTVVILDKQGRIRWTHIGEGLYDEQEQVIRRLLSEEA